MINSTEIYWNKTEALGLWSGTENKIEEESALLCDKESVLTMY